jgi:hypothetical protein
MMIAIEISMPRIMRGRYMRIVLKIYNSERKRKDGLFDRGYTTYQAMYPSLEYGQPRKTFIQIEEEEER